MNKISALLIGALSLGFVACENFDLPNPPAQTYPQDPAFNPQNVVINSAIGSNVVNLVTLNANDEPAVLATADSVAGMPEGYDVTFVAQVAASDAFENPVEVATVLNDQRQITASADDLNAAFYTALATKDPSERDLHIRYIVYAVKGSAKVRLGDANTYFGASTGKFLPFPPAYTIEDTYYLIGTPSDLTITGGQAIEMSNSGGSPYDNPEFSCVVNITNDEAAAGYKWAVVAKSTLASGTGVVYAPAEDTTEESGVLTAQSTPGTWVSINQSGRFIVKFNAEPNENGAFAFSWMFSPEFLYTPGNSNGWDAGASQVLAPANGSEYQGYVNLDGEFKFTSVPGWDGINYGSTGNPGELSTDGGAGNLSAEKGLYWVTVDIVALTYSLSAPITTYGVIGDATPNGWDASTALTPSDDMLVWTGTIHFAGSGEFKFRANDDWDVNLGGDLGALSLGGANIPTPGEGDYEVTLDLSTVPYAATLVKK